MMRSEEFVVYVETNWLVSCVLPHSEWRIDALSLLDAAERGECVLRIPRVALLEAGHVVIREMDSHARAVEMVSKGIRWAGKNINNDKLRELGQRLVEGVELYKLKDSRQEIHDFSVRADRFGFSNPVEEQIALDWMRPRLNLKGGATNDVYILAAIVADRGIDGSRPAAVLSTNSADFGVKDAGSKLPLDFYSSRRMVYLDRFKLELAGRLWHEENERGWQPPARSSLDPRIAKAQKLLHKVPEGRRDELVVLLQGLLRPSQ